MCSMLNTGQELALDVGNLASGACSKASGWLDRRQSNEMHAAPDPPSHCAFACRMQTRVLTYLHSHLQRLTTDVQSLRWEVLVFEQGIAGADEAGHQAPGHHDAASLRECHGAFGLSSPLASMHVRLHRALFAWLRSNIAIARKEAHQ